MILVQFLLTKYLTIITAITIRYWVIAGGYYLIAWKWLDRFLIGFRVNLKQPFNGQQKFEIYQSFLTTIIFGLAGTAFIYFKDNGFGLIYFDIQEYGRPYWYFSIFLMLLINDIYFYWTHRLLHAPKLFSRAHYIHHKSRVTTPLTSQSFHAIESFINVLVVVPFPFLFPIHPSAYITFTFLAFLNNAYGHGNYDFVPNAWKNKAPFKYLNSPTVHGFHHSNVHGNYGLYTNIWDRIHGTYIEPKFEKSI